MGAMVKVEGGNSQVPLLLPGITSSPTPSLTLVNSFGPPTATPTWSSPLKNVRAEGLKRRNMALAPRTRVPSPTNIP
jgi:hypothetical protein